MDGAVVFSVLPVRLVGEPLALVASWATLHSGGSHLGTSRLLAYPTHLLEAGNVPQDGFCWQARFGKRTSHARCSTRAPNRGRSATFIGKQMLVQRGSTAPFPELAAQI